MIKLADRSHAALSGRADILSVIIFSKALRSECPACDAPEQQRAYGLRIFQREQEGKPAAGRATAEHRRQSVELREQLVEVVGPGLVFRRFPADDDVGDATIPAVVNEHAVAGVRHALRQRFHHVERAAPSGRKRNPRSMRTEQLIIEIGTAELGDRHARSPDCRSLRVAPYPVPG